MRIASAFVHICRLIGFRCLLAVKGLVRGIDLSLAVAGGAVPLH